MFLLERKFSSVKLMIMMMMMMMMMMMIPMTRTVPTERKGTLLYQLKSNFLWCWYIDRFLVGIAFSVEGMLSNVVRMVQ